MTEKIEDWRLVGDVSQKKRIQNRVAQRTYRTRMKQRVEELEKQVENYKRQVRDQQEQPGDVQDRDESGSGSGSGNLRGVANQIGTADPILNGELNWYRDVGGNLNRNKYLNTNGYLNGNGIEHPGADQNERTNIHTHINNNGKDIGKGSNSKSGQEDKGNDKGKGEGKSSSNYPIYMDTDGSVVAERTRSEVERLKPSLEGALPATSTLNETTLLSPQNYPVLLSHSSGQPTHPRTQPRAQYPLQLPDTLGQTPTDLSAFISPPHSHSSYNPTPEWPWPSTSPQKLYRDSMGHQPLPDFQTLSTSELLTGEQQGVGFDQSHHIIRNIPYGPYGVQPSRLEHSHHARPDGDIDPRITSIDRSSSMVASTEATTPSSSASVTSSAPIRDPQDKNLAKVLEFNSRSEQPLRSRSLEDRFEFIQLCVASAGFSNFDAMVRQYYTADFSHDSILARQQQSSRSSQLPVLLAKLRKSSHVWSEWEAHGYKYEIIKSIDTIIRAERGSFIASRASYSDALFELECLNSPVTAGANKESSPRVLRVLNGMLQDTAPKLYTLTECLVASDSRMNQRQQSYTSLAILLLLCCSSQLPGSQSTALVTSCLNIAHANS